MLLRSGHAGCSGERNKWINSVLSWIVFCVTEECGEVCSDTEPNHDLLIEIRYYLFIQQNNVVFCQHSEQKSYLRFKDEYHAY